MFLLLDSHSEEESKSNGVKVCDESERTKYSNTIIIKDKKIVQIHLKNDKYLINYIKKYKYLYKRYFKEPNPSSKGLLTDGELTTLSIQNLFIIAGI
jgi:hypothetical protein